MKFGQFITTLVLSVGVAMILDVGNASAHDDQTGVEHTLKDAFDNRTASIPTPPPGKVALRLSLTYVHKPLPGQGIQFFEAHPEVNSLWAQESLKAGEELPVGREIKNGILFLKPGEFRMVTVAYRNPTSKTVNFMVEPHRELPAASMKDTWLTCLCMAFLYEAPAKGSWYRVIQVKVSPKIPAGSKVDTIWPVLTDASSFPKKAQ